MLESKKTKWAQLRLELEAAKKKQTNKQTDESQVVE